MMCQRIGRPPISTIGLGLYIRFLGQPRTHASCQDRCLHHDILRAGDRRLPAPSAGRQVDLQITTVDGVDCGSDASYASLIERPATSMFRRKD